MVESALLFGSPPGALRMPLTVGEAVRSKQGELEIPVTLGLPVDLMTVVPEGNKYTVHLELRFAASDASGDTADVPIVPVTLTSDHHPPRQAGEVRDQGQAARQGRPHGGGRLRSTERQDRHRGDGCEGAVGGPGGPCPLGRPALRSLTLGPSPHVEREGPESEGPDSARSSQLRSPSPRSGEGARG